MFSKEKIIDCLHNILSEECKRLQEMDTIFKTIKNMASDDIEIEIFSEYVIAFNINNINFFIHKLNCTMTITVGSNFTCTIDYNYKYNSILDSNI